MSRVLSRQAPERHDRPGAVTQPEDAGTTEAGPLSAEQVAEVARDVIRQLAPEELVVFDSVAEAWLADGRLQRPGKPPGASAGFGLEEVLLTELTFPIIAAAVGEVLAGAAEERIQKRAKRRAERQAAAVQQGDRARAAQRSGVAARDVLTGEQALAVRDACERHARTFGMSAAKSKSLADAVLGSLTYPRGAADHGDPR